MPVWIEPKGSRRHKLDCFVQYLRLMNERHIYVASATQDEAHAERALAQAGVYGQVAQQLEALIG